MNPVPKHPNPNQQPLSVGDALLYLDKVKMEFSDKPEIYNEFLDIMKNFKAQEIDTPGVIQRVSTLFRGYNKLILGFNTFLPEGYKIDLQQLQEFDRQHAAREAAEKAAREAAAAPPPPPQHAPPPPVPPPPLPSLAPSVPNQAPPRARPPPGMGPQSAAAQLQALQSQEEAPRVPQQQVEFKQAKDYVTTIKKRFASEPNQTTYKAFLKILHHYQEEQRNIMDVLEQVSSLFADHPDLLKEFTYFLPDAVQEQAKERLNRAARESEMRKAQREAQQASRQSLPGPMGGWPEGPGGPMPRGLGPQGGLPPPPGGNIGPPGYGPMVGQKPRRPDPMIMAKEREQRAMEKEKIDRDREVQAREQEKRDQMDMERKRVMKMEQKKMKKKHSKFRRAEDLMSPYGYSTSAERQFFDQAKDVLMARKPESWMEFIKLLNMYSQDLLTRKDMLEVVKELFGKHLELYEEFKNILNARSATDAVQNDVWFSMPLSEIDFSQCRKCTPSYRALPKNYPKPTCTERSPEEEAVLNDTWVSVPVGSEENYSFKHMRKNQYEEALFKCEDERFEIDMVIDSNTATIRVLEPLADEIAQLKAQEDEGMGVKPSFQYRLDKRTLGTIHLNAITRIYGDHGQEVLELLKKNPAGAIPVILRRLKQKDHEWRKARQDLNKSWKELLEKNYHKSLDHRSFYFRNQDKKQTSARFLVQEIKDKKAISEGKVPVPDVEVKAKEGAAPAPAPVAPTQNGQADAVKDKKPRGPPIREGELAAFPVDTYGYPQMLFKFPEEQTHKDVYKLLGYGLEHSTFSGADREKVSKLWKIFLSAFLSLPPSLFESDAESSVPTSTSPPQRNEQTFISTQNFYYFLRLYQIMYERMRTAKEICEQAKKIRESNVAHPMKDIAAADSEAEDHVLSKHVKAGYDGFIGLVCALLDSSMDTPRYEEGCRQLMGNASYILYTMDKLIGQILKQLQVLANDETFEKLQGLYYSQRSSPSNIQAYRTQASNLLVETGNGEEGYRLTYIPGPKTIGDIKFDGSLMLLEFLGNVGEPETSSADADAMDFEPLEDKQASAPPMISSKSLNPPRSSPSELSMISSTSGGGIQPPKAPASKLEGNLGMNKSPKGLASSLGSGGGGEHGGRSMLKTTPTTGSGAGSEGGSSTKIVIDKEKFEASKLHESKEREAKLAEGKEVVKVPSEPVKRPASELSGDNAEAKGVKKPKVDEEGVAAAKPATNPPSTEEAKKKEDSSGASATHGEPAKKTGP